MPFGSYWTEKASYWKKKLTSLVASLRGSPTASPQSLHTSPSSSQLSLYSLTILDRFKTKQECQNTKLHIPLALRKTMMVELTLTELSHQEGQSSIHFIQIHSNPKIESINIKFRWNWLNCCFLDTLSTVLSQPFQFFTESCEWFAF